MIYQHPCTSLSYAELRHAAKARSYAKLRHAAAARSYALWLRPSAMYGA